MSILDISGNDLKGDFKKLLNLSDDFKEIRKQLLSIKIKQDSFEKEFLDDDDFLFTPKKSDHPKKLQNSNLKTMPENDTSELTKLQEEIKRLKTDLEK